MSGPEFHVFHGITPTEGAAGPPLCDLPTTPSVAPEGLVFEFGPYRLEIQERVLRRGPEVVFLTPKAFDTLALLVQRGTGRLVSKDELTRALWPNAHVEENNLQQHISLLRRTLIKENPEGWQWR